VALYRTYTVQLARLRRQRDWLIELQRLLKPKPENSDSKAVERQVDRYLNQLAQDDSLDGTDQAIAQHIVTTFRNRWWGLFVCYDVPGLPATNNKLEGFFGHLKTNQRRITGHKSVNSFVLRYGAYAAFVDKSESKADLLTRFQQFDRAAYQRERQQLQRILSERKDYHRFCHKLDTVVKELEAEWDVAVKTATQSTNPKN
jgi:hypothetical protein